MSFLWQNVMAYEAAVADLGFLKGNLHTLYYDGHQLGLKVGNTIDNIIMPILNCQSFLPSHSALILPFVFKLTI